jgi:hypothetical protein
MLDQATLRGHIAYASRDGSNDGVQTGFDNILVNAKPLDGQDNDWLDIDLGMSLPLGGSGLQTSLDAEHRDAFSDDYTSYGARLSLRMRFLTRGWPGSFRPALPSAGHFSRTGEDAGRYLRERRVSERFFRSYG